MRIKKATNDVKPATANENFLFYKLFMLTGFVIALLFFALSYNIDFNTNPEDMIVSLDDDMTPLGAAFITAPGIPSLSLDIMDKKGGIFEKGIDGKYTITAGDSFKLKLNIAGIPQRSETISLKVSLPEAINIYGVICGKEECTVEILNDQITIGFSPSDIVLGFSFTVDIDCKTYYEYCGKEWVLGFDLINSITNDILLSQEYTMYLK